MKKQLNNHFQKKIIYFNEAQFWASLVFNRHLQSLDNKIKIPPNTFPKAEKLKSRKAIDGLFKGGKSFFIHPYKVFYQMAEIGWRMADGEKKMAVGGWQMADSELDGQQVSANIPSINSSYEQSADRQPRSAIQVGFAVSTKNFKHAVDRNRIKRLGREAYRLNKHQLISQLEKQPLQLQVFFVFTNKSLPTFVSVEQAMQACLRKLIKITKKDEGLLQG